MYSELISWVDWQETWEHFICERIFLGYKSDMGKTGHKLARHHFLFWNVNSIVILFAHLKP